MDLYYAAKKYILPELVDKCSDYMTIHLCPEYTCRILEFPNLFEDEDLKVFFIIINFKIIYIFYNFIIHHVLCINIKEECLSLLRERTVESLAPPDFEELPQSTVLAIVQEEDLNIRELELFNAVGRWAEHQCALRDVEVNGNNMRQV